MKTLFIHLLLTLSCLNVVAQTPATRTTVLGLGVTNCGGSTRGIEQFSYNAATNVLTNVSMCTPVLTASGSSGGFSTSRAGIDFNPKDRMLYYYKKVNVSGVDNTYIWRWDPAGTCPNNLPIFQTFLGENLTLAFDAAGNGWVMKLTAQPTVPVTNLLSMRKIDFTTLAISPSVPVTLPAGVNLYTSNGDYLITPEGKMFFAYDNKLMTVNYQSYDGVNPLTATYIDTIRLPSAGQNLVGLAYANGEFVGHFQRSGACNYGEINILTGVRTPVTGSTFSSSDNSSVTSGIGVAKQLVSVTPHATISGRYTVSYDVFVKNYGNYPVNSVQIIDSLQYINGVANVVAGSVTTTFIDNPGSLNKNPSYNGTTDARLLVPGQTLVNTPATSNHFTIRVTADLTNITPGIIYYNSAVATGAGYLGAAIRDSSTNGLNPDLNLNEKPDDAGESVKTPFVITVASETPPCSNLTTVLHQQNFNVASDQSSMPSGSTTNYTGSLVAPLANDRFVITNNPATYNSSYWASLADHSGGGRMMVINADVNNEVIYSATVNGLCSNQKYSFSAWIANVSSAAQITYCNALGGFKYPRLNFRVRDAVTGVVLTNLNTSDISANSWTEYGMRFVLPSGYASVIVEIINIGEGGCGNDLAIDDVQFGLCDPAPVVTASAVSTGCLGGSTVFNASLSDASVISGTPDYQWQISTDNTTWSNISGATSSSYTIVSVTATDANKYYRVLVAASGNLSSPGCRYSSAGFYLTAKTSSTAPASISKDRTTICPGDPIVLRANGGTLGTNANYQWYSGSCGGTYLGSGSSITVTPAVATTYYVRIEGDCNTTACVSIAITFNCDIDADDDGIPDVTESNGVDPKPDSDYDGIPNWRDANYAGFTDTNADGVNDNFDSDKDGIPNFMDRDSDNDGIPDVVESGGADSDGNGIIDGYTDTDGDGFSQNVDANNTGATGSGTGLDLPDLDGDGVPNYIDLDSDNDGIPDVVEAYGTDANNDGRVDYSGTFAANDTDSDGLLNSIDGDADGNGTVENVSGPLLKTGSALANGRASWYPNKNVDSDSRANPYDLDSDSDGIVDVMEALFTDANFNGRIDGAFNANGWSTVVSALGSLTLPNRDGTGRGNVYDIDSDDDGIPDNIEGQCSSCYVLPSGMDTDGDGIDNNYDDYVGFGGKGIAIFNMDGDAYPDYLDTDTDGDGMLDVYEGNDFNMNKRQDDNITLTGIDTDGDGLDNRFDNDNGSSGGTSRYMGNGGSFSGPGSPGSNTMVQRSWATNLDRDWRYVDYVLPVAFLSFKAALFTSEAELKWAVSHNQGVNSYIVQRSVNGSSFENVHTISGNHLAGEIENYSYRDDISLVTSPKLFYQIKAVEADGSVRFSNMVTMFKEVDVKLKVVPNPVHKTMQLVVNAIDNTEASISIIDIGGRVVYQAIQKLNKGMNVITISDTKNWLPGNYLVKVAHTGKINSTKFIVQH